MMSTRSTTTPGSADEHPTRRYIRSVSVEILKERGPAGFRIDEVLERTGLTRGAIYHHFENVDDLFESAVLAVYSEGLEETARQVREVLSSTTTFDEFRDGVFRANLNYVRNDQLRTVRRLRAYALGNSSERILTALSVEQQRLTDEYIAMIVGAQERRWVRAEIDPLALAVFIQAYSFGVIVDDIAQERVEPSRWTELIEEFFMTMVFELPSSS